MRLIILSIALLSLAGCKSAEWHLGKALEKGATIGVKTVTVKVTDTLLVNGKDSIIEREIEIPCPDIKAPKPKWEVRFDNRRFNDSLSHVRKIYSDSLSNSLKTLKIANRLLSDSLSESRKIKKYEGRTENVAIRAEKKNSLFLLGMVIGSILSFGIVYAYRRFRKIIFPENQERAHR